MDIDTLQNNKLQLLGKMTASLVHEIRNPLSAIKLGVAHLMMIESELPAEAIETVQSTAQALDRIQVLVENVLDFTRKSQDKISEFCVNDVTKYALTLLNGMALKSKVNFVTNYCPQCPTILADRNKVLQLFINLINNAIEACELNSNKEYKQISISTSFTNNLLSWEIQDEGIGITEENKAKIFSDFFTNKQNGTGLGLTVCNNIVKEYNSKILFESKIGEGTKFSIYFNPNLLKDKNEL